MSEVQKKSVEKEYLAAMLKGISNHMLKMGVADGAESYAKGFAKLQSIGVKNKCTEAKKDANEGKNRYRNVPAYDHTRVLLKTKNDKGTDYINANWITGFGKKKKYIASQGPVPDSIHDFWSMVWENKVTLIVKVTREVENGVLKCHRYWPDPEQHPPQSRACDMGKIEVEYESAVSSAAWITRKFTLRSKKDGEVRSLTQLSYEAWPDHGVPLTSREFLTFRRHVKTVEQQEQVTGPILIHCSAGVGRTGTYITVDRVLDAISAGKKDKDLDLDKIMADLRNSRVFMVQTLSQYEFTYRAVADGIRQQLKEAGGYTLSRDLKEFYVEDTAKALEEQKDEDVFNEALLKNTRAALKASTQSEIDASGGGLGAKWKSLDLDIGRNLTNLESRVQSLKMTGSKINLEETDGAPIQDLIRRAKALEEKKRTEREAVKQAEADANAIKSRIAAAARQQEQVNMMKKSAQKKSDKFMSKMTKK